MYLWLDLAWIPPPTPPLPPLPPLLLRVSSTRRLSGWLHRHPLTLSHSGAPPPLPLYPFYIDRAISAAACCAFYCLSRSSHNLYAATPSTSPCTRKIHTRIYRKELKLNLFITRIRSSPSPSPSPYPSSSTGCCVFQLQQLLLLLRHLYGSERGNRERAGAG